MDYEKKYKEAFKWIESLYPKFSHEQQMEAEAFFPELKESEDERMRKSILIYLDWLDGRKGYAPRGEYTISDMISWLEKQGQTFTSKDVDDAYLKGVSDAKHELGKQGEQKPGWSEDDNSFCKENCKGYQQIGRCFADGDCKAKREAEQKPTWSEEDFRNIENIDSILFFDKDLPEEACIRLRNWLKSLKERIGG